MPRSRWPTQNSGVVLYTFCLISLCLTFFFHLTVFLNVYYDFQFCISIGFIFVSCVFYDTFIPLSHVFLLIVCFPKREVKKMWSWAGGQDLGGGEGKQWSEYTV